MRRAVVILALAFVLAIAATLVYDYLTISESEAEQISERYIASHSSSWKFGRITSDHGDWVVMLTPVEHVPEAKWLYIDKHTGKINKIMESD